MRTCLKAWTDLRNSLSTVSPGCKSLRGSQTRVTKTAFGPLWATSTDTSGFTRHCGDNSGKHPDRRPATSSWVCHRDTIVAAPENDWMEWQAGYICGALLMPRSNVIALASRVAESYGGAAPVVLETLAGRDLIAQVRKHFQVSEQAAQVRLSRLGLLVEE